MSTWKEIRVVLAVLLICVYQQSLNICVFHTKPAFEAPGVSFKGKSPVDPKNLLVKLEIIGQVGVDNPFPVDQFPDLVVIPHVADEILGTELHDDAV